jgi:predicted Zn-dependent protease
MMSFVRSDEELALVLSHEYAHNVMGHVASQQVNTIAGSLFGLVLDVAAASQGFNTGGGFQDMGGQVGMLTYSAAFEAEADYVGLYIMQHAGYDTSRALEFWRRMGTLNPDSISEAGTHPSTPERFVAMQKTMGEIQYKKSHNILLLPDFRQNP